MNNPSDKAMNILVTGGAGFIGSHFIEYLLRTNTRCRVVNVDKLTYAGNLQNLKSIAKHKRYHFVHAEIGRASCRERV